MVYFPVVKPQAVIVLMGAAVGLSSGGESSELAVCETFRARVVIVEGCQ